MSCFDVEKLVEMSAAEAAAQYQLELDINDFIDKGGVWEEQTICVSPCGDCGRGLLIFAWWVL
jgi:hypothetical protein